jgi:hypothetical protein
METSPIFTILAVSNIGLWVFAGIMTIGSNYYGFNIVNFIVGFLFFLIGYYWYIRSRNTKNLMNEFERNKISSASIETVLRRTINLEIILIIMSLLVVLVANLGVGSRVLIEKMSVFG